MSKPYRPLSLPDRDPVAWVLPIDGFLPAHRLVLDSFPNLRALALHPLLHLETSIQLVCQLTDLPPPVHYLDFFTAEGC